MAPVGIADPNELTGAMQCQGSLRGRQRRWAELAEANGGLCALAVEQPHVFASHVRKGIPPEFRWQVWRAALRVAERARVDVYQSLLLAADRNEQDWSRQIALDVPRTFPRLAAFDAEQQQRLRRVLQAFATLYPEVGYCQGMNFIAGLFVIASQDEEEAFWAFVCLMDEGRLKGFYVRGFPLLQLYIKAFRALAFELEPEMWQHLIQQGIQPDMFLHRWFMTLFADCLDVSAVLTFWDSIICCGLDSVLTLALTLLRTRKAELLHMQFEDLMQTLNSIGIEQSERSIASVARGMVAQSGLVEIPRHISQILSDNEVLARTIFTEGLSLPRLGGLGVAVGSTGFKGYLKQGLGDLQRELSVKSARGPATREMHHEASVTDSISTWWEDTKESRSTWWKEAQSGLRRAGLGVPQQRQPQSARATTSTRGRRGI